MKEMTADEERLIVGRLLFIDEFFDGLPHSVNYGLSRNDKIKFAYYYFNQKPDIPFEVLYDYLKKHDLGINKTRMLYFFSRGIGIGNCSIPVRGKHVGASMTVFETGRDRWLKDYVFNPEIVYSIVNSQDEKVTITKEVTDEILNILRENEIPTKDCIVKVAIRKYIQGEIFTFIDEIKTGTFFDGANVKKKVIS